ncbi:MAG TPA: hypothetical protein VNI52_06090 [Sphingobacteriaceae bacterium]|nr:hypothetical protein [Sphingobacteriaceae bacterium]
MKHNYCILLLASYDFEAIQLTLKSLDHTVTEIGVPIIVILNGGSASYKGSKVEKICRDWARSGVNRHIIRPVASGKEPLFAIQETIASFDLLKDIKYILKIDDDLIPLKPGWATDIANLYHNSEEKYGNIGFTTGLINNNSWGFKELLTIYDKWEEYRSFMNHASLGGRNLEIAVKAGAVDTGLNGTIWQYPALAAWLHEWTSFEIPLFISKTKDLKVEEIAITTHYSIGCMYSHKDLWLNLVPEGDNFDELLIHQYCLKNNLKKFAAMYQPFLHLFYFKQRLANAYLFPGFMENLARHFNDPTFQNIIRINNEDRLADIEEKLGFIKTFERKFGKIERILLKVKNFLPFKI